jgi:UDP-N-acetylmuramyl pentapeptide synthase
MNELAMTHASDPMSGLSLDELRTLLADGSARVIGDGDARVYGVRQDSRKVQPGELFCARRGGKTSGAEHAIEAQNKGAVALLVERGQPLPATRLPLLDRCHWHQRQDHDHVLDRARAVGHRQKTCSARHAGFRDGRPQLR